MELIPSFTVDHIRLLPGIYVSRIDTIGNSYATTFDIRMKRPNLEPVLHPNAMHTIEHIVARKNAAFMTYSDAQRSLMGLAASHHILQKAGN